MKSSVYSIGMRKMLKSLPATRFHLPEIGKRKMTNSIDREWKRYLISGDIKDRPPLTCLCVGGIARELKYIKT